MSNLLTAQSDFVNDIQAKVAQMLSSQLDGNFQMVSYPSGFHYGITYGANAYFNPATLSDIDNLLSTSSSGELDLTGNTFTGLYLQLMQNIAYVFSQADQKTMNDQDNAATAQISSVITEFTNAGGVFTNPLPFGGKIQDVINQVTKQYGSIQNIPASLNGLRNALASYEQIASQSYTLHSAYYAAQNRLTAIIANLSGASSSNGGMQTGANSFYPGFTPANLPTANQLIGGLQSKNSVSVNITMSDFSSSSMSLSVEGDAGIDVNILDIIGIDVNSSTNYDFSKYSSAETIVTMNMEYPGVTLFSVVPTPLSLDLSQGWYANDILTDVVKNTGNDASGYALQGTRFSVADVFGVGQELARLKTYVISQQPTITMTFTGVSESDVMSFFNVNASTEISLFGFRIGGGSTNYAVSSVQSGNREGSVVVTFGPPAVSGTIPLQNQVAYVLGGVASYPPKNI